MFREAWRDERDRGKGSMHTYTRVCLTLVAVSPQLERGVRIGGVVNGAHTYTHTYVVKGRGRGGGEEGEPLTFTLLGSHYQGMCMDIVIGRARPSQRNVNESPLLNLVPDLVFLSGTQELVRSDFVEGESEFEEDLFLVWGEEGRCRIFRSWVCFIETKR